MYDLERYGFSLSAIGLFAVSEKACCSLNASQRYYISIAVYEYVSKNILLFWGLRSKWGNESLRHVKLKIVVLLARRRRKCANETN